MRKIAMSLSKGGVGKTTTVVNDLNVSAEIE